MRVSLTVFSDPPARDFSRRRAWQWYLPGDIINVQAWHGEPEGGPRFVFVHVTDIPEPRPPKQILRRLKTLLLSEVVEIIGGTSATIRRRKWRIVFSRMPQQQQNALRRDRNMTITWPQLRILMRAKTVHDNVDPSKDTDEVTASDGDL